MTLTVASLCSGYEATGLGLTLAGWDHRLAFVADPDPAAAKVLAHHHPDVRNLGDITRVAWGELGLTGEIDLLHAGFPCTDISAAGRRAGLAPGTRSGIWANVADAIDALRPRLVLIENVAALLSTPANRSTDGADSDLESGTAGLGGGADRPVLRAIGAVLGDLSDLGFDAVWITVSAASVGAPHLRKRVFILAWPTADHTYIQGLGARRPSGTDTGGTLESRGAGAADLSTSPGAGTNPGAQVRLSLLPTPASRDWKSGESNIMDRNARPLNEVVVNLLPTPRATDGSKGGPNQRGSSGDLMLPSAVMLLPTPTVADARGSRNATAGRSAVKPNTNDNGWTLADVAYADRWGDYAPAIARWEQVTRRSASDPTEPGKNGQPRLSARFVEWMQGLPDGYVTAVPGISRNDALRLLGNSNPPQQYAAAVTQLAAIVAAITAKEVAA